MAWRTFYSTLANQFLVTEDSLHPHWQVHKAAIFSVQKNQLQESNTVFICETAQTLFSSAASSSTNFYQETVPCTLLPSNLECNILVLYFKLEQTWNRDKSIMASIPEDHKSVLLAAQYLGTLSNSAMIETLIQQWIEPQQQQWDMERLNTLLNMQLEPVTRILLERLSKRSEVNEVLCCIDSEQFLVSVLRERRIQLLLDLKQCAELFTQWLQRRVISKTPLQIARILLTFQTELNPFSASEKAFLWDHFSPFLLNIETGHPTKKKLDKTCSTKAESKVTETQPPTGMLSSFQITFMGPEYFKHRKEAKQLKAKVLQPFTSSFHVHNTAQISSSHKNTSGVTKPTKTKQQLGEHSKSLQVEKKDHHIEPSAEDVSILESNSKNEDILLLQDSHSISQYLNSDIY